MEPATLIAMTLGAAVATSRPKWDNNTIWQQTAPNIHYRATNIPSWGGFVVDTEHLVAPSTILPINDARDYIRATIHEYSLLPDDWNGEGALAPTRKSLDFAEHFLNAIPPGFSLPRPMLSSSGNIEYYWSASDAYADISFDEDGVASLFIKVDGFNEKLLQNIKQKDINSEWFVRNLGFFATTDAVSVDGRFSFAA